MRRQKNHFAETGAQVVLVGMGTVEASAAFKEKFDIPFPIIADPNRKLYQAFDLKRMRTFGFFSPTMMIKGVSAITKGHRIGVPQGDIRQLPGVFVIDAQGRIRYAHYADNPADHPDAGTILEALKTIIGS